MDRTDCDGSGPHADGEIRRLPLVGGGGLMSALDIARKAQAAAL